MSLKDPAGTAVPIAETLTSRSDRQLFDRDGVLYFVVSARSELHVQRF